jgi:hypothetical protein
MIARAARRTMVTASALGTSLVAACGSDAPSRPTHVTHAMVGTYALEATFTSFVPDIRRAQSTPADASLAGTLVVGDTVELRGAQTFFPDVRLTAAFCARAGQCDPAASYASFTSLFGPGEPVTFGFSDVGGARLLHFEGPLAGDSIAGPAYYQVGTSRYDGRCIAREHP